MSQDNPKVSVIIPVFNAEKYLCQCLDNIVNQTLRDIEVICVDDGSTDGSPDILREYAAKDKRIRIITQEKSNAGAARNNGLSHASGKYCIFLDADDFFDSALLEKAYKKILVDNSDIVAFNFYRYYEDGTTEKRTGIHREWLTRKTDIFNYHDCPDHIMSIVNPTPWTKLYRTAFLLDHKFRFEDISLSEDITFASVSVAFAERISILDDRLVYYRVGHEGTITSSKNKKLGDSLIAVKSGVEQVSRHQDFEAIKNSAMRFAVENIVFVFRNYISDFNDPVAREFYTDVKAFFNTPFFNNCSVNALHSKTLYDYFRCIRDNGYFDLVLMISGNNALPKNIVIDDLIVSLTSYPPRISTVYRTIETLLNQTIKPGKLILWLSEDEFPNREGDLPGELLEQTTRGLEIEWCSNIISYKKLIPALKKYPDAIIVTADDDLYYHEEWLERLYINYLKKPDYISCHRVTKFSILEDGKYSIVAGGKDYWPFASYLNKFTGVGGVLYPPHCFHPDMMDESKFMKLAPTNDDIWFWLMVVLAGYKVDVVQNPLNSLKYVEGTQDCGLWHINDHGEKLFWVHFYNILQAYPQLDLRLRSAWREDTQAEKEQREMEISKKRFVEQQREMDKIKKQFTQLQHDMDCVHKSVSFRTGRAITFVPRKVRGGVRCCRDHGFSYTIRRTVQHLSGKI